MLRMVCIIPARMGSTRFPGKPLAPICGRPMIEHVYRRCRMNPSLDAVYVATCDREISEATDSVRLIRRAETGLRHSIPARLSVAIRTPGTYAPRDRRVG